MSVQKYELSNNESIGDFTHIAVFDYTDIDANLGPNNQVKIGQIPAGGACELCYVYEATALASTANDYTLDVGTTSGDPDEFIDNLDVDGLSAPAFNTGESFTTAQDQANKLILAGATNTAADILVEWNGSGDLTAGKVVIGLRIIDPARFA